jgi:hypothetical protein
MEEMDENHPVRKELINHDYHVLLRKKALTAIL